MPESWEVASEDEWNEIQRGILRMFATGSRFVQQAIGKALDVEPLPQPPPQPPPAPAMEKFRAVERELQPPGKPPTREEELRFQVSARQTDIVRRLEAGEIAQEEAEYEWRTAPESVYGNIQAVGLGAGPELRDIRGIGDIGQIGLEAITPLAPPEATAPIARLPVVGPTLERQVAGLTSPLGAFFTGKFPAFTAGMVPGATALGTAGRATGLPGAELAGELVGGMAGGVALPAIGRAALPAARAGVQRAAPAVRRLALEEIGGPKPKVPTPVKAPTFKEALIGLRQQRAEEKLVPFIRAVKGILDKRAKVLHQHRQRQAGALDEIWKSAERGEITPEQAEAMHFGSLKGEVDFPELQALGEAITPKDMHALKLSIVKRTEMAGLGRYDIGNAMKALEQLKDTGQLAPHQADLLTRIFGEGVGEALVGLEPAQGRLLGEIWELLGIPRGVQASFDISFPLRQGIMLGPRHPQIWAKGTQRAFKGFINPKWADAENAMILREQAESLLPRTLDITRPGVGTFAERAEPFMSHYLRKIPGIWRSEASFNVAGNRMRRDLALSYAKRWSKNAGRALSEGEMDELGRVVNYLTGRGPVPRQLAYTLSQILYSPRFLTSKPAFLVKMVTNIKSNPRLSEMMAEELVAFVGTGVGLLSLLKYSGAAEVEINPLSSDFGKIKIGNIRFDIWGGGQQLVRYTAQMIMGQRKTLGTGELVDADRKWVAARLAMSKVSPQAGIPLDWARGESYMGEEIEPRPESIKTQIWNRLGPLAIQDILDAVRKEQAKGLISLPALMGVGVLTFETPGEKIVKIAKEKHGVDWVKIGKTERLRLEDQDPEIAAARQEQLEAAAKWGASASLELRQEHAEFEGNLAEYLQRPDMTLREAANQYRDYVQKQAAKNEERWKDAPESDPRSELDRKIDEFYAEEYPTWGTDAEKDAWYQNRAAMRVADPDLDAALLDLATLRFKDSTVREFVKQYEEGQVVKHQLYQIPRFTPLSLEEGNRVSDILREAQSLVQLGKAGGLRGAIYMIVERDDIPDKLAYVALYPQRFQSPERQQFRHEHADELAIFESLPVDVLEGLVVD